MPLLRLTRLLQTALPELSKPGRAVVNTLGCLNGHAPNAHEVAAWVGLRDRYQLSRTLRRDGLPSFELLSGWARVLYWVSEAETTGASLLQLARRDHTHPTAAYRLVRRVTGACWSQIRRAGLGDALRRFRESRQPRPAIVRPIESRVSSFVPAAEPRDVPTADPLGHLAGVLAARVAVQEHPFDVAVTPTDLALVTCAHAAALDVIGLHPLRRCGSIPTGPVPTCVQVSRNGEWAYVTSQFGEQVDIIDLRTGRQVDAIPIPGHPLGAALAPNGRTLYVTSNTDQLHAVALGPKRVTGSVRIPLGMEQLAIHPAGHRVYVSGWKTGTVTECDASSLRVVRTFRTGGITQDIVVTTTGTLFAANQSGWVDVIALTNGRRLARIATDGAAFGLALSPAESVLLVSFVVGGDVCVIDPKSFHARARIITGGRPRLMAFDRSGRMGLVVNEAGWVDQIV